jgi:hypothetical protein
MSSPISELPSPMPTARSPPFNRRHGPSSCNRSRSLGTSTSTTGLVPDQILGALRHLPAWRKTREPPTTQDVVAGFARFCFNLLRPTWSTRKGEP